MRVVVIPLMLLIFLTALSATAQNPTPPANQVMRVTTDSTPTKAVVTIYLQDRAVVFALPTTGDVAYVSSVSAPGGKLVDKADSTTSITLRPGSIPGIDVLPTPVPPAPAPVPNPPALKKPAVSIDQEIGLYQLPKKDEKNLNRKEN